MEGRVVLFVSHADADQLRMAGSCALTAASMGDRVDVFLFGPAVAAVVEARQDPEHPAALLHQARQAGPCRLLACSAGALELQRGSRPGPAEVEAALDAVVGWPTALAWSRGVVDRFFF